MDTLDARRASIRARIASIRTALKSRNLAALVVPSSDPHLSEYLPDYWKGREFFSGFTGSVGTLIVTADFAGVWVDGRYWMQAETQLAGTGIELMKLTGVGATAHVDWLATQLRDGSLVAVDGKVLGLAAARQLQSTLAARGIDLLTDHDVLNDVWTARPPLPTAPVFEHVAPFAPTRRSTKLAMVRAEMKALGATHHFVSTVDDIAWLTNLRGADVQYNPVFLAHLLIDAERATLFIGESKVAPALKARLEADGIVLAPYARAAGALAALTSGARLLIDPRRIAYGMQQSVAADVTVIEAINPSTLAKSRKTDAEAHHIRAAMEQDGAALAEFFAWFEGALGHETITELTIDERITAARARRPGYVCPSFSTIAGFNANGALPHYRATEESHATVCMRGTVGDGLLLIDSGGQYEYGTTDITRVVPVGSSTVEQRRDFTLVLKGMIALSRAKFPRGTRSPMLDTIARAPIWAEFADFGHGTGHGVGYFLNVHEGPHGITPHLAPEPQTAMEPGMVTSNEPGLYRPGKWGVRIENLVLNVPAMTTEFGEFLQFETLTLCPIDTRLVDTSMMSADELMWLDSYHAEVRRRVGPHVSGPALTWLTERTRPVG
ncbi:MAG: M24 family metallopeptidase [Burkholderiaceae bacterium]